MSLVYFTDRDLGKRFPEILTAGGLTVHRHADHFAPDCPDEEWLKTVGEAGWVAITHDRRIRYKPNELAAVVEHKVRLLVVVGKTPFPDLAGRFMNTVPKIENFLAVNSAPLIAKVYRASQKDTEKNTSAPGSIVRWYPTA